MVYNNVYQSKGSMINMLLSKEAFIKELLKNVLYHVITGSTSYGLSNKDSDVDEKCIVVVPKHLLFTLGQEFETYSLHDPKDLEIHVLKKIFNLLRTQNPTVKEMLWTEERFILKNTKYGQLLRDNREMFLCQNVYDAFGGYARQQLMRIKGGLEKLTDQDKVDHLTYTVEKLLGNFPKQYTQAENGIFMLNEVYTEEDGKQNLDLRVQYDNISLSQLNGMCSELYHTTKTYNKAGKRNRKSEGKLTKHAMHLLRLLISGMELLETGKLQVYRTHDRDLLLDVRNEKYTWDEIFEMVAYYQDKLEQALKHTSLPKEVDERKIQELYTDMSLDIYAA